MSRNFSSGVLGTLYAKSSNDPLVALLTITHADIVAGGGQGAGLRRYARSAADVVSNSDTFFAALFDVNVPAEVPEETPVGTLLIDTVTDDVRQMIRSITTPAEVVIEVVLASAPDSVLASWTLEARVASYDLLGADIELAPDPVLFEPYPGPTFSPARFPGMFKRGTAAS